MILTYYYPIRKYEELDIRSKGTEHQATCHHYTTKDGHRSSPKVVNAGTADGT